MLTLWNQTFSVVDAAHFPLRGVIHLSCKIKAAFWKCNSFPGAIHSGPSLLITINCLWTGEKSWAAINHRRDPHHHPPPPSLVSHHWVWLWRRTVNHLSWMRRRGDKSSTWNEQRTRAKRWFGAAVGEYVWVLLAESPWAISQHFHFTKNTLSSERNSSESKCNH